MNMIYFDNAATTPVREEVFAKMEPWFSEQYGNPSSIYNFAKTSKKAIEEARSQVAVALGADIGEIFFTGSGTEADNWAIKGIADGYREKGKHIITSSIEHHAVLNTCEYLAQNGFEVTYLPVDEFGMVCPVDVEKAIRPDTILISIMFANNEIGTIQPIEEIGAIARKHKIVFHTDAVQAVGHIPIDLKTLPVDLLSLSAHKLYGPKGVGVLYVKKGIRLKPFVHGGGQERNKRGGTENVAGIVGLGEAITLLVKEMEEDNKRITHLRDKLIDSILKTVPYTKLNGHPTKRLPGNINISFEFIEGEGILLKLDYNKICASSGSACTSGSLDPSHVLLATGMCHASAHGSLRLSLGRYNAEEEADRLLEVLPTIIEQLRAMSPLYDDMMRKQ